MKKEGEKGLVISIVTSSLNIVEYEPELKSLIVTSVVLALTVKSFSSDKTNLQPRKDISKESKILEAWQMIHP